MKRAHRVRSLLACPRRLTPALYVVVVATAIITAGDWVKAEPGPSVFVRVELKSPALDREWGAARAGVIASVQKALAGRLKDRLPHWEFALADAGGAAQPASLLFSIAEAGDGSLSFQVLLRTPTFAAQPLAESWMTSVELLATAYPSAAIATDRIVSAIGTRIFERHDTAIRTWLSEQVPIAVGAHWMSDRTPRLVLALPSDRYDALRESVFRLVCDWPNRGTAFVESVGPGLQAPYAPPPPTTAPNPPFDGVVVVAREREFAGQKRQVDQILSDELFELRPRFIFLKEYRPVVSGWNVAGGQP